MCCGPFCAAEADKGTAEFTQYWENDAALVGSKLVYNTGRSLGSFLSLLQAKAHCIAVPDVLITAVGTKVWLLEGAGRTGGSRNFFGGRVGGAGGGDR